MYVWIYNNIQTILSGILSGGWERGGGGYFREFGCVCVCVCVFRGGGGSQTGPPVTTYLSCLSGLLLGSNSGSRVDLVGLEDTDMMLVMNLLSPD